MAYSPCCAQAYLTTWNRSVGVWIALATEPFSTALYRQMDSWTPPVHQQNCFFFLYHLLDPPCVLQMPSFGRRAKAHLANTPTERLSLRQPLVLLRYTMNGFLASNGNGFIASNPNWFPRHLQRSCTGAAASFLQVAAIAAFSAG